MAYSIDEEQDLSDNIDALESASKTPARSRSTKPGPIVDDVCDYASQHGLPSAPLLRIIQIVTTKSELDQTSQTTLIKSLYPVDAVQNEVVTLVVRSLGQSRFSPPPATQAALLKWLIAVYDVLAEQNWLGKFYAVLFNLLDMVTIRGYLCQLLALVTQRRHVRPFRIQRLLELVQVTAHEPALINLLRVYKNFCPDLIVSQSTGSKIPMSQLPDPEWRQRLRLIQQNNVMTTSQVPANKRFRVLRSVSTNGQSSMIPKTQTLHVEGTKRTLEEIQSVEEFVEYLERIETPSQVISVLQDPLFQKYIQLGCSPEAQSRLEFWLTRYFEDELETLREGFGLSASLSEILAGALRFTESTKILHTTIEQFLRVYLPLWNGQSDSGTLLDLLTYIAPQPFSPLHASILTHLEISILANGTTPFTTLLNFCGDLATRWIVSNAAPPTSTPRGFLKSTALLNLTEHAAVLGTSALCANHTDASSATLSFYERLNDAVTQSISNNRQILPPILPPPELTYLLLSTPNLSNLNRLCALLVTCKKAFETQTPGIVAVAQPNATQMLNGYIVDVCNMLWRGRALNATDANAKGCLVSDATTRSLRDYLADVEREYALHTFFDLSHSALLSSISQSVFAALEHERTGEEAEGVVLHAGPVTQRSLVVLGQEGGASVEWKEYRVRVLEWLEGRGVEGVKALMFGTMRDLGRA